MIRRGLALALVTTVAMASVAGAQASAENRAALRLRVVADSLRPVPAADVRLAGQGRAVASRTDDNGAVRFEGLPSGLFKATVRRIGFAPATVELRLGGGENALTVHLDQARAYLDEVRVVADQPLAARLDDFEMRRLRGDASSIITLDEIAHRRPIALSQMLRGKAGIRIADSLGYILAVSTRGAKFTRAAGAMGMVDCVLRVMLDGVVLPALSNIDAVVPSDVYGVEIFYGAARLPVQFAGLRTDNWCGVIAIWTRDR
ncbi:MAG: carboxypeptidase regulatory-like domain-containing protein [Gemmatimonadaceae bacterium]|nr:carboxypeptidase regulatory-like domain-containing protein [Gemmatimonadaceae bacterium]